MKRIVQIGWLAAAVVLAACVSESAGESAGSDVPPGRRDIPGFFLNPPTVEDQYVGLGTARLVNDNLSRTTAQARARRDIAVQISVAVESMLTDYAQESGADGNTQTLTSVEQISKEVADIELNGAVTQEQYAAADGTWYVMVYFPKAALLDEVQQVFNRNEDAAFADFKAQEALGRLNAELENSPPKSAGVNSPVNQD